MTSKLFVLTSNRGKISKSKRVPVKLRNFVEKERPYLNPLESETIYKLQIPFKKRSQILWFNDKPYRKSGSINQIRLTQKKKWNQLFNNSNPNGSLTWIPQDSSKSQLKRSAFEINRPYLHGSSNGTIIFELKLLEGSHPPLLLKKLASKKLRAFSLFIDDSGEYGNNATGLEGVGNIIQGGVSGYAAIQTFTSIKGSLQTALTRLKEIISDKANAIEGWSKISDSWMQKLDSYIRDIENIKLDSASDFGDLKAFIQEDKFTQNFVNIFTDSGAGGLSTEDIASKIGDEIDPEELVNSLKTIVQSQAESAYDILSEMYSSGGNQAIFEYYTNTFSVRPSQFWSDKDFFSDFTSVVKSQDPILSNTLSNLKEEVQEAVDAGELTNAGALDEGISDLASTAADSDLIAADDAPIFGEFLTDLFAL